MLKVVHDEAEPSEASCSVLDEIVREAARQMLAVALQAEVSAYISLSEQAGAQNARHGRPRMDCVDDSVFSPPRRFCVLVLRAWLTP